MNADVLLATKLLPPALRPGLVPRRRLLARLDEGLRLGRPLTLVSAPPGFGKTTLIHEWAATTGRPVAWLALDSGDNDPRRLARYMCAAVEQAAASGARGTVPGEASPQALLAGLINGLAGGGAVLLVLDDYHVIRDFAAHDLVISLLAHPPAGLHLVISTREDPPLPLARLRARDQVTELRELALRFTPEEAGAFLNQTMRLSLSAGSVAALAARTEGWITGLQLAGLALRQATGSPLPGAEADRFVAAFAGDDRYVVDYLMAEVLERAPAHVRTFLRQTAVLERLTAPLCNALTGRDDSQAILEGLEAANLFLVSLDNRREWYRYHVLFAEALRMSLAPAERADLHRAAAAWYAGHNWDELAGRHRQLAGEAGASGGTGPGGRKPAPQPLIEPISARELEVLDLLAQGSSNAEIGQKLYIAVGTVKRHVNNIYGKLGAASRTQAVARARALGLLK